MSVTTYAFCALNMTRQFVQVVFKISSLPSSISDGLKDDSGMKLGIVGSIPELGSWQAVTLLAAEPCGTEENAWMVTSRLPISATFTWTCLVTAGDGRVVHSDPAGHKQTVLSYFSGIVETTWGLTETTFISQTSAVKIRVHYHCQPGEVMTIVGSEASLGSWEPKKAIRAKESPSNSSNWIAQVLLDNTVDRYQWKWVVLDSESGNIKRWEEGCNRHLEPKGDRLLMLDTRWGCESVTDYRDFPLVTKRNTSSTEWSNNDQMPSCAAPYAPVNWLNNANTTDPPFEITDEDIARVEAAIRASEPRWWSYIRRLPVVLPFIYNWCRV